VDLMDGWNQRRVSSWWGSMGWNKDQDEDGEVRELIVVDIEYSHDQNYCRITNFSHPQQIFRTTRRQSTVCQNKI